MPPSLGDDLLQGLLLALRLPARAPTPMQKIKRRLRGFRHRIGKLKMREAFKTEKLRALGPQLHHFGGNGAIVRHPAAFAAPASRR